MITLYSTHCPRCKVLEQKLSQKNIDFNIVDNEDEIIKAGYSAVPVMLLDNEKELNFAEAVNWINNYRR